MDSEGSNQCELRAIVGDTNSVDAELLRLYLSTMFADVIRAASGPDVVALVVDALGSPSRLGVVVVSRKLPELDGIEATRLTRDAGYTGTIIGTCWDITGQIKDQWRAAGANAILMKPISLETLFDAVLNSVRQ